MPRHWSDNWEADDAGPIRCSGHAIVRRVVGREDGREGALKILTDDAQNRRERRFRLKEEVNALDALRSGVPRLYDTNAREASDNEELFFVMEWIPGSTLTERVSRGVLSLDEALQCTGVILDTLDAMHALPLVHRDLKPDNIILRAGATNDPVIIDLGLAWADTRSDDEFQTEHGQEVGNRFLRLPEFAPGRAHRDPRSDVTLVAGLLLYMFTARAPRLLIDEQGRAPHDALSDYVPQAIKHDARWVRLARVLGVAFQTELELRFESVRQFRGALSKLDPEAAQDDVLTPALERLQTTLQSDRWRRHHDRLAEIGELGSEFDGHLRSLLRRTGLQLPGRHGFDAESRVYSSGIGLQPPGMSGGTVCWLRHEVEIGTAELSARYRVTADRSETYYSGPLADIGGLREAMWRNAEGIVAEAVDEFTRRTVP